jgi:hypothetical protein
MCRISHDSVYFFCSSDILCITILKQLAFQYNKTNVMQFSFNLLKIKSRYMFRALLAHPQEVLNNRHLVYCIRIMSVGCGTVVAPPEDEQIILETCSGL